MEINISELRKKRKPLWMSELDEEVCADILGGGGDIYSDRLPVDSERGQGEELSEDEELLKRFEGRFVEEDYIS